MTDVEQPASVPSFGGFGKFVFSPLLFSLDTLCCPTRIRSTALMRALQTNSVLLQSLFEKVLPIDTSVLFVADAFADAETDDNNSKDYVHIRIQQRNGKKSLTTVQVIPYLMPFFLVASVGTLGLAALTMASSSLVAVFEGS